MKVLSEEEKLDLRNRAKKELEKIEKIYNDENNRILIDKFKETFLMCEVAYKVILEEHQKCKGKNNEILKISMNQVPFALQFAGYDFEKELLTKLFGAEDHVGKKSVKKIRDSLTHSSDTNTVKELNDREEEIFSYMNEFLEKIRVFDEIPVLV